MIIAARNKVANDNIDLDSLYHAIMAENHKTDLPTLTRQYLSKMMTLLLVFGRT